MNFDVFLSHNSKDKPAVRQIAEALKDRGLKVWLDEWELTPGRRWITELEKILETAKTAAVCVGRNGFGAWEQPEMEGALTEFVRRGLPVIPVLLPDAPADLKLPLFLKGFTWVDLRGGITEEGLDRLEWGIRGTKPTAKKQAQEAAGPKIHNLPFPPLRDLLKGRDEELRRLETNLQDYATAITQAIHGLGGIGKTRLAVEYAWRSVDRYDAVLFVVADSPQAIQSGLANLARPNLLNLPEYASSAEAETADAVLQWFRESSRWLLILDNVDTAEAEGAVREILPQLQRGHVLITSRRKDWPSSVRKQTLDALTQEEAIQFLLQRTDGERDPKPDDSQQVDRLATILDGLPLALEQAAAYIAHYQGSFARYLKDWEEEHERVLDWYDENTMQHPPSVAATWQTTFQQLSPKAAAILRLTAYLAPDPIPLEMLEDGDSIVEEAVKLLHEEIGKASSIQDALAELAACSMITKKGKTLTIHRIVQTVVRDRIPEERRQEWIEKSLRLVDDLKPVDPDDIRTWSIWDLLRHHASVIVDRADRAGIGREHSEVAIRLNNLAALLRATNRLSEAEPMMRRALELDQASFGEHHPRVAIDLNNLALLLKTMNRLSEAEPMMRRALEIDQAVFGEQHPNIAIRLNNLASLLKATNRLSEAEPMMWRALEIDQAVFGEQHPKVAIRLNNLAQLLKATNRLSEAEPMMQRALKIDQASFGEQHPKVAIRLNNLAQLLQDTDRLSEAEPMMRRAVEIFEASLGADHPDTVMVRKNLERLRQKIASETEPPSSP